MGPWLLWRWRGVGFLCPCKFCCINDLWEPLCKWMVDNECLTGLGRVESFAFRGGTNAKLILGITRRRSGPEEWIGDEWVTPGGLDSPLTNLVWEMVYCFHPYLKDVIEQGSLKLVSTVIIYVSPRR
jgi:hypothetical protein